MLFGLDLNTKKFSILSINFILVGIIVLIAVLFNMFYIKIAGMILLILLFLMLCYFYLKKVFYLFIISISLAPAVYFFCPVHPILKSIRLYELVLVSILVFEFIQYLLNKKLHILFKTNITIPIFGILFISVFSLLISTFLLQNIVLRDYFELIKPIRLFLIVQVIFYFVKDRTDVKKVLNLLIVFSTYVIILGVFEHIHLWGFRKFIALLYSGHDHLALIREGFDRYGSGFLHVYRVGSVFASDVNAFGGYTALFTLIAFIYSSCHPSKLAKLFFFFISFFHFYGVFLSGSRKALICVILGIGVFLLLKIKKALVTIPVMVLGAVVTISIAPKYFFHRLFSQWELKIYNIVNLFEKYASRKYYALIFGRGTEHEFGIDSFHIKLLLKNGILGFVAYYFLLFVIVKTAYYVFKNARDWLEEFIGMIMIILTISIEWMNLTGLYFYAGRISESYWIILGLLLVVYKRMIQKNNGLFIKEA